MHERWTKNNSFSQVHFFPTIYFHKYTQSSLPSWSELTPKKFYHHSLLTSPASGRRKKQTKFNILSVNCCHWCYSGPSDKRLPPLRDHPSDLSLSWETNPLMPELLKGGCIRGQNELTSAQREKDFQEWLWYAVFLDLFGGVKCCPSKLHIICLFNSSNSFPI